MNAIAQMRDILSNDQPMDLSSFGDWEGHRDCHQSSDITPELVQRVMLNSGFSENIGDNLPISQVDQWTGNNKSPMTDMEKNLNTRLKQFNSSIINDWRYRPHKRNVIGVYYGIPRSGKTTLAHILAKELLVRYRASIGRISFSQYLREMRSSYREEGHSENQIFHQWAILDFLVIDDIDYSLMTTDQFNKASQKLTELVTDRLQKRRATILITNHLMQEKEGPKGFNQFIGPKLNHSINQQKHLFCKQFT